MPNGQPIRLGFFHHGRDELAGMVHEVTHSLRVVEFHKEHRGGHRAATCAIGHVEANGFAQSREEVRA